MRHIEAWDGAVLGRILGAPVDLSAAEKDWPPVRDRSAAAWALAVRSMETTHAKLNKAIAGLTLNRLDEIVDPGRGVMLFHLIHGVVQHEIYHAGQIALLKKG